MSGTDCGAAPENRVAAPKPRAHLVLKEQEIPFDHPASRCSFRSHFYVTSHALATFPPEQILDCLRVLQAVAERHRGIDYLQVFKNAGGGPDLWFIEDEGSEGHVTALLPEDY